MKFLYHNSKLISELEIESLKGMVNPIIPFIETPILCMTEKAKVRLGLIDLKNYTEYAQPIQLGSITLREIFLFKQYVNFIGNSGTYKFFSIKADILSNDKYSNSGWILDNLSIDYLRYENIAFFFNIIIPLYNFYINRPNDLDNVMFFTLQFCKKRILNNDSDFEHKYPMVSKYFIKDVTFKKHYEYVDRVGRDDHAYETTYLSMKSPKLEEFLYLKLICNHLSDKDFGQKVRVSYDEDKVIFSCCSMYDNNAWGEHTHDIPIDVCNAQKDEIINSNEDIYWEAFERFKVLYKDFKNKNQHLFR